MSQLTAGNQPHGAILNTDILHAAPDIDVIPVSMAHAGALSALIYENQNHLRTFLPRVTCLSTYATAQEHLEQVIAAADSGLLYEWHIFRGDQLCGAIRLNHIEADNRKASIACYLGRAHQGIGVATNAARVVIAHSFAQMRLNRIEMRCASHNLASQRMATRLGFKWEGMLRHAEVLNGAFTDHFVYGLLHQELKQAA